MSHHFYFVYQEGYMKFGDTDNNHATRRKTYATNNPLFHPMNYVELKLHGNFTPSHNMGTVMKRSLRKLIDDELLREKCGLEPTNTEWFMATPTAIKIAKEYFSGEQAITTEILEGFFMALIDRRKKVDASFTADAQEISVTKQ